MRSPFERGVDWLRKDDTESAAGRTTGKTKPHLDGIRGIAVLFIFIRHAWGLSAQSAFVLRIPGVGRYSLAPFVVMMSSGVDLFFVLSAFLLSQQFIRANYLDQPRPDLGRYFRARILRIGPPYWVVLVLTIVLLTPSLIPAGEVYSRHGFFTVLLHACFLQTAWFGSYGAWNPATPFWTLTIEMLFYLVLPWVVPLFYRERAWRVGLPLAFVVTFTWLVACRWSLTPIVNFVVHWSSRPDASPAAVRYWLSQQIPSDAVDFAAGMVMANVYVRKQLGVSSRGWSAAMVRPAVASAVAFGGMALTAVSMWRLGVPSLAHSFYFGGSVVTRTRDGYLYYFFNQVPFGIAFAMVIGGVSLGWEWLRRVFGVSGLAVFGVLGYSIYLIHMQLLYHFNTFASIFYSPDPTVHFLKLASAAGVATLLCSLGLYLAVERPFMMRARRAQLAPARVRAPRHARTAARRAAVTPVVIGAGEGARAEPRSALQEQVDLPVDAG